VFNIKCLFLPLLGSSTRSTVVRKVLETQPNDDDNDKDYDNPAVLSFRQRDAAHLLTLSDLCLSHFPLYMQTKSLKKITQPPENTILLHATGNVAMRYKGLFLFR
jgi:hypothetical protein